MSKVIYFILFVGFSFFSIQFFNSALRNYRISQHGSRQFAEVVDVPNCSRSSNSLYVKLKEKKYLTEIGKNECIQGKYLIGQKIEVLYSSDYDKIIMPYSKTKLVFYMSLAFFILPIASLYYLLKGKWKSNKVLELGQAKSNKIKAINDLYTNCN